MWLCHGIAKPENLDVGALNNDVVEQILSVSDTEPQLNLYLRPIFLPILCQLFILKIIIMLTLPTSIHKNKCM